MGEMLGTLGLIFEPRKKEIKDTKKAIVKNIWSQIPEGMDQMIYNCSAWEEKELK